MKQALHIFLKDLRGLRVAIAVLMAAIAWFAVLDVRLDSKNGNSGGLGILVMEIVVAAAVWFLIARAVHEDALPDENQFWLTRPYERGSLLFAKILMAVFVVGVPLLIADCAILATQSLPFTNDPGGVLLRQLITAVWLIVPPFAIASVTRTLAQNVVGWLVVVAISVLTYFPGALGEQNDFRAANERYALTVALALIAVAIWRQYSQRATITSRAMIAAAVLLPALPFPESTALAIEQLRDSQPQITSRILLTPATQSVTEPPSVGYRGKKTCVPVPVNTGGVPPGWHVMVLSQNDTFEAGGKTWSSGWHRALEYTGEFMGSGYISVCASTAEVRNSEQTATALHTSIALAVFAPGTPVSVPATLEPFDAPGIGRCQFLRDLPHHYSLLCKAPVWIPPAGEIAVAGEDTWSSAIGHTEYAWTPFHLLPGLSPVYKWVTMPMDEGTPPGVQPARFGLQSVIRSGGEIEFRLEKQVAVVRREVSVREVRFR